MYVATDSWNKTILTTRMNGLVEQWCHEFKLDDLEKMAWKG